MRSPFAYAADGSMLVTADGPELFAFGANDGPLWKKFTDGIIVGVAGMQTMVISVDSDGRLASWRGVDGTKLDENTLDVPGVFGLVARPDGQCAVLAKDVIVLTTPKGGGSSLPAPGVSTVAWGPKGQLAIGTESGEFQVIDEAGKRTGQCTVGGAVTGIAFRAPGQWAVAAGTKVTLVTLDGVAPGVGIEAAGPTGSVSVTADGALFAVMAGTRQVTIGEFGKNHRLGTITWQRDVSGLGFGQQAWLAIGLDEAEANRVDLGTGQICKTEPAHGRVGSKWPIKVECEPERVRQAITAVRTSGKAIATHIDHYEEQGGNGCLYSCLASVLFFFLCSGCTGLIAALYYFVYLE